MGPHRGKGLIDFLVDHNPFNLTLPGLNYCGPGNDLKSQIARNISPTNPLDNACRAHDIAYENSKDSSVRRAADQKLLDAALERIKSSQSSFLEKVGAATVAAAMKGKMMLGGKLGRRKSGQLKRLQVRSMPALGRRKRRGGKRRSIPSRATLAKRGIVMPGAYVARRGEIEFIRTPGIVSTLKTLVCSTPSDLPRLENSGFNNPNDDDEGVTAPSSITKDIGAARHFSACVPLRLFFGFFEDVKKVLINTSQELVLMRASNDYNVFKGGADNSASTLILDKISLTCTESTKP
ncbi:hypothetical protein GE061_000116 [Apolygus lucorum]|uniref:Uncharacterized protein n=1 Tax=Apolygus lucorum TaxID=248454 RepID=A0A8S9Y5C6_APOLU|nr:hypothetical protein GE061_000116 [Apolygus lucorum]